MTEEELRQMEAEARECARLQLRYANAAEHVIYLCGEVRRLQEEMERYRQMALAGAGEPR